MDTNPKAPVGNYISKSLPPGAVLSWQRVFVNLFTGRRNRNFVVWTGITQSLGAHPSDTRCLDLESATLLSCVGVWETLTAP